MHSSTPHRRNTFPLGCVAGRDTRFTSTWFVDFKIEGERVMSYSRDMIFVVVA